MIDFDREMNNLATTIGGSYRRYSDDILWVCALEHRELVNETVRTSLQLLGSQTKINSDKTEISTFTKDAAGLFSCDRPVQYLGFIFDGRKIIIRSQTLSKYSRRVVYATRAAKRAAAHSTIAPGVIFKRKLYRQLSHLGRRNLISYAKRSEALMQTGAIRNQVRRHMDRISDQLAGISRKSKAKPPPPSE